MRKNKKRSRRTLEARVFVMWWVFCSAVQVIILNGFGLSYSMSITDSLVSNVLLAGVCLLVINNMRYYVPKHEKYWYVAVISLTLSCLWLLLMRLGLWALFRHDQAYMSQLTQTSSLRFLISFLIVGCFTLVSLLWFGQQDVVEENRRTMEIERQVKEGELNKLRQQLQPHFLFNSLNSISALTLVQPEKARFMIQQLSDFLRGTLKKEDQVWSTFEEEVQYLKLYLEIEKVRFGYRLQTIIDCSEEVMKLQIPSLLLQPVVENAIKFGLYDTLGEVTIVIKAVESPGMLKVSVDNPFDVSTSVQGMGTGFGLASIRRRLFLLFGRNDLLEVKTNDDHFITIISIPQINESNNN